MQRTAQMTETFLIAYEKTRYRLQQSRQAA
jgi:hypothetical protein